MSQIFRICNGISTENLQRSAESWGELELDSVIFYLIPKGAGEDREPVRVHIQIFHYFQTAGGTMFFGAVVSGRSLIDDVKGVCRPNTFGMLKTTGTHTLGVGF